LYSGIPPLKIDFWHTTYPGITVQTTGTTAAVDALSKITGWDARKGRLIEDAAKAYLETCR
jgi:hypothetical protein